jgi:hypothetical protein
MSAGNQPNGNERPSFTQDQLEALKPALHAAGCSNVTWMLAATRWLGGVGHSPSNIVSVLKARYPESFRKQP